MLQMPGICVNLYHYCTINLNVNPSCRGGSNKKGSKNQLPSPAPSSAKNRANKKGSKNQLPSPVFGSLEFLSSFVPIRFGHKFVSKSV
jgi:hypothetical protein